MPESVFQSLVDGLPAILGDSWIAYSKKVAEEINSYAKKTGSRPIEVLREMRNLIDAQEVQWEVGGPDAIQAQKVLLFALREQEGKLGSLIIGASPSILAPKGEILQEVRNYPDGPKAASCPSQESEPSRQQDAELGNLVHELSHEGASCFGAIDLAQAIAGFPLAMRIPGRVGMLKGSGNAIVPELAARFIKAYMEAVGIA